MHAQGMASSSSKGKGKPPPIHFSIAVVREKGRGRVVRRASTVVRISTVRLAFVVGGWTTTVCHYFVRHCRVG